MRVILERAVDTDAAVARLGRDFAVDEAGVAVGGLTHAVLLHVRHPRRLFSEQYERS